MQAAIRTKLEEVLGAMSAELGEIAQAAREGKISRDQAEYLTLERYYVALTRFQLLRMLYQPPQESNPPQSYVQANTSSQISGSALVIPPVVCSPDIPNQLVDYLQLTPREIAGASGASFRRVQQGATTRGPARKQPAQIDVDET